jgi:enolase
MNPARSKNTLLFGNNNTNGVNQNSNQNSLGSSNSTHSTQDDVLVQAAQLANSLNREFSQNQPKTGLPTPQQPVKTSNNLGNSINQPADPSFKKEDNQSSKPTRLPNFNQTIKKLNNESPSLNNNLNNPLNPRLENLNQKNEVLNHSEKSNLTESPNPNQKNNNLENKSNQNLSPEPIPSTSSIQEDSQKNINENLKKKFGFNFEKIKNKKEVEKVIKNPEFKTENKETELEEKAEKQILIKKPEVDSTKIPNITITNVNAREILDSRGIPTVEVIIKLSNGSSAISSISTSINGNNFEATQIRDHDENRMLGLGVLEAVKNINKIIAPNIIGLNPFDQGKIDLRLLELDGTKDSSKLGSNATMTVSQTVLKAGSIVLNLPTYYYIFKKYNLCQSMTIPTCLYGLIDGGKHGSKNNIDFQEFQIIPANHVPFDKSLEMAVSVFNNLKKILIEKGAAYSVGPSGGYTPNLFKNTDAFELLIEAIKNSGYNVGRDVFFGIDADGTSLEEKNKYKIRDFNTPIDSKEMIDYYKKLNSIYGLYIIEDPFSKNDEKSWIEINKEMGEITRIVGDNNLFSNTDVGTDVLVIRKEKGNAEDFSDKYFSADCK